MTPRDEDLVDAVEALIDAALAHHYNRTSEETFVECRLCTSWEAHRPGCPIPALEQWLKQPPKQEN